jgi:hypothetical protein
MTFAKHNKFWTIASLICCCIAPTSVFAQGAQQTDALHFDMVCSTFSFVSSGTYSDGSQIEQLAVGSYGRLQFDLEKMRYAQDRFRNGIDSVTSAEIIMSDGNRIGTSIDNTNFVKVRSVLNRRTGLFQTSSTFYTDQTGRTQTGTVDWIRSCNRVPYTGIAD